MAMTLYSGVGSGVAPGARAPPPCWIFLESFHKRGTCFVGRIFRARSGRPSPAEPPRGIERAWLREATADLAFGRRMCLELERLISGYILLIFKVLMSCDFHSYQPSRFLLDFPQKHRQSRHPAYTLSSIILASYRPYTTARRVLPASDNSCYGVRRLVQCVPEPHAFRRPTKFQQKSPTSTL